MGGGGGEGGEEKGEGVCVYIHACIYFFQLLIQCSKQEIRKKIICKIKRCHTTPFKRAKKQGEMPLPSLSPIPSHHMECVA